MCLDNHYLEILATNYAVSEHEDNKRGSCAETRRLKKHLEYFSSISQPRLGNITQLLFLENKPGFNQGPKKSLFVQHYLKNQKNQTVPLISSAVVCVREKKKNHVTSSVKRLNFFEVCQLVLTCAWWFVPGWLEQGSGSLQGNSPVRQRIKRGRTASLVIDQQQLAASS